MTRRSIGSTFCSVTLRSTTFGCRICLRLKASICRVSSAARSAARLISSASARRGSAGSKPDHHDFGVADDRRQQVVEVVRDAARQPADGFHLLRVAQLLFERDAALQRVLAFGHHRGQRLAAERREQQEQVQQRRA